MFDCYCDYDNTNAQELQYEGIMNAKEQQSHFANFYPDPFYHG